MKSCNLKTGDRVRFSLKSPYSKEDLKYGCDPRVNGMTGTIQCIWDIKEPCVIKLDTPLVYDNNKEVYEYWDFTYNMVKISEEPHPINFEKAWNELKNYLNSQHYLLENSSEKDIVANSKLYEIDEIIEQVEHLEHSVQCK